MMQVIKAKSLRVARVFVLLLGLFLWSKILPTTAVHDIFPIRPNYLGGFLWVTGGLHPNPSHPPHLQAERKRNVYRNLGQLTFG